MLQDDPYRDRDLVQLYDLDNPGGRDHEFYRGLAVEVNARSVVDLGCGTGLLTRSLALPGRRVIGIDPSKTMLDYARTRPGAEKVTWLLGDASVLPSDSTVDLVLCTGNAIMHIEPERLSWTLSATAAALHGDGTLSFETRNPDMRAWERWNRTDTYTERMTHLGVLREWLEVTAVGGGRVVFDAHNLLPSGLDRVYTSELYFHTTETLRQGLLQAGFDDIRMSGGWNGGPLSDEARVIVVRADLA